MGTVLWGEDPTQRPGSSCPIFAALVPAWSSPGWWRSPPPGWPSTTPRRSCCSRCCSASPSTSSRATNAANPASSSRRARSCAWASRCSVPASPSTRSSRSAAARSCSRRARCCCTILCGIVLARSAGLARNFGLLTGGSVAICGASAALAIASVLPRGPDHERDTIMTVVAVTALSTIAMVLYPVLAGALGFDPHATGYLPRRDHPRRGAGGRCRLQRLDRGGRHGHHRQAVPRRDAVAGSARHFVRAAAFWRSRRAG